MTFIKSVQGLGDKAGTGHITNSPPNVAVFDGSTRYIIGDAGTIYDPLPVNTARTYFTLHKKTSLADVFGFIYNTRRTGNFLVQGEFIADLNSVDITFAIGREGNIGAVNSIIQCNDAKWHSNSILYDGTSSVANTKITTNGIKTQNIRRNEVPIGSPINNHHRGHIGYSRRRDAYLIGEIALLSIYTGVITHQQETEFVADPFGFISRLRVSNPSDFYLDVDFDRITGQLPIDLSTNNFPITLGAGTATFTPFN